MNKFFAGLLILTSAFITKAQVEVASCPDFSKKSLYSTFQASVIGIEITDKADIILLDAGAMQGFRTAALVEVKDSEDTTISTLIITKTNIDSALALVLQEGQKPIQIGQKAQLKTTKL